MSQKQVAFKSCKKGDGFLFPPYLGDLIPANHPVRLIDAVVDKLDISDILATYKPGGTSCYHPRMLIKLLVYGYFDQVTSSRKLEQSTHENICYMWLCGMNKPSYATISTFRSGKLKGKVKDLFASIVKQIYDAGELKVGTQFIDGTIFESAANKKTYVWRKNTERYKSSVEEKIKAILADVDEYLTVGDQQEDVLPNNDNKELSKEQHLVQQPDTNEEQSPAASDIKSTPSKVAPEQDPLHSEDVKKKIDEYKRRIDKKVEKKVKKLEKDLLPRLLKYEEQERILNGRNSYSKTDTDAGFMRMKEDRRGKADPKPAYNVQISTNNQFILNFSVHQNVNDAACYVDHMTDTLQLLKKHDLPDIKKSMGDAIYGTQENYEFLEKENIDNYLKYPFFDKQLKKKIDKKKPFHVRQLFYNEDQDFVVCPMGQRMHRVGQKTVTRKSGYEVTLDEYQNTRCENCPLRGVCHKGAGVRKVQRNTKLERYRKKAFENLTSEKGWQLRRQRSVDVEPVFGHIKFNRKWDRFTMVGLQKVEIELGLQSIAHNLRKWAKTCMKKAVFASFAVVKIYRDPHNSTSKHSTCKTVNLPQTPSRIAA